MIEIGARVEKLCDLCGDPVKKGYLGTVHHIKLIAPPDKYQYRVRWDGLRCEKTVMWKYIKAV